MIVFYFLSEKNGYSLFVDYRTRFMTSIISTIHSVTYVTKQEILLFSTVRPLLAHTKRILGSAGGKLRHNVHEHMDQLTNTRPEIINYLHMFSNSYAPSASRAL